MAKFNFSEIVTAFEYRNSSYDGDITIILRKDTGEILFRSKVLGKDKIGNIESEIDKDLLAYIPHKDDIDLGKQLVFNFAGERMQHVYGKVRGMFHHRGAYQKFIELLERKEKLREWHEYESEQQEKALRRWCKINEIELED